MSRLRVGKILSLQPCHPSLLNSAYSPGRRSLQFSSHRSICSRLIVPGQQRWVGSSRYHPSPTPCQLVRPILNGSDRGGDYIVGRTRMLPNNYRRIGPLFPNKIRIGPSPTLPFCGGAGARPLPLAPLRRNITYECISTPEFLPRIVLPSRMIMANNCPVMSILAFDHWKRSFMVNQTTCFGVCKQMRSREFAKRNPLGTLAQPKSIKFYRVLHEVGSAFANCTGTANASHRGRLAVEQIYGYMCWNSQVYGILTTASGFVFLFRDDGGTLWMSQMFGSNSNLATGGYIIPATLVPNSGFTISHVLYWFTHLTETTPKLVEKDLAQMIQVMNAYKPDGVQQTYVYSRPYMSPYALATPSNPAPTAPQDYLSLVPAGSDVFLDFKPWLREKHCGGRACRAILLDGDRPVVVKSWDGYKWDTSRRDNETHVYMRLQTLWNVCVPRLIAKGEIDFCHSIVIDHIEVSTPY